MDPGHCVCRDTLVYFSFCPHNVITSTSISTSNFHKQIKINPLFLSNMCGETCPLQRGRVTTWLVCCHTVFLFSTPPNFVLRFTALGKYKTVLLGRQVGNLSVNVRHQQMQICLESGRRGPVGLLCREGSQSRKTFYVLLRLPPPPFTPLASYRSEFFSCPGMGVAGIYT